MNKPWNDELISAYLDGELTAAEQAQVEQALASDTRLRQMHDDLRALRHSLQSMPRLKLGDDFAARVLAQARQAKQAEQVAAGTSPTLPVNAPSTSVTPAPSIAISPKPQPIAWKVAMWSIGGIAAAILCVLLLPQEFARLAREPAPPADVNVALGKKEAESNHEALAKPASDMHATASDLAAEKAGGDAKLDAGKFDAVGAPANLNSLSQERSQQDNLQQDGAGAVGKRSMKMRAALPESAADRKAESAPAPDAFRNEAMEKSSDPAAGNQAGPLTVQEEKQAERRNVMRALPGAGRGGGGVGGGRADGGAFAPPRANGFAPRGEGLQAQSLPARGMPAQEMRKDANRFSDANKSGDARLKVVVIDAPIVAGRERQLEAALARHGIRVADDRLADGRELKKSGDADKSDAKDQPGEAQLGRQVQQDEEILKAAEVATKRVREARAPENGAAGNRAADDVELVYLEASPAVVDKVLGDLQNAGYAVNWQVDKAAELQLGDGPAAATEEGASANKPALQLRPQSAAIAPAEAPPAPADAPAAATEAPRPVLVAPEAPAPDAQAAPAAPTAVPMTFGAKSLKEQAESELVPQPKAIRPEAGIGAFAESAADAPQAVAPQGEARRVHLTRSRNPESLRDSEVRAKEFATQGNDKPVDSNAASGAAPVKPGIAKAAANPEGDLLKGQGNEAEATRATSDKAKADVLSKELEPAIRTTTAPRPGAVRVLIVIQPAAASK